VRGGGGVGRDGEGGRCRGSLGRVRGGVRGEERGKWWV